MAGHGGDGQERYTRLYLKNIAAYKLYLYYAMKAAFTKIEINMNNERTPMALINCPDCHREISDKAQACPHCGHPGKQMPIPLTVVPVTPIKTIPGTDNKLCPVCKSENTQSIKMMCLSGTSTGRSTGVGVSTDLDIGIGRLNSKTQTALAKKHAPGTSPMSIAKGCSYFSSLLIFVWMFFLFSRAEEPSKFFLISTMSILVLLQICTMIYLLRFYLSYPPEQIEWDNKVKYYEKGYICHKCGETWVP